MYNHEKSLEKMDAGLLVAENRLPLFTVFIYKKKLKCLKLLSILVNKTKNIS
jgi:hypothetical protein